MQDRAGGPDARSDDLPRIRPSQILQQHVIMGLDRHRLRSGGIGVGHQQNGLFRHMDLAIDRIETVDDRFELR